MITVTIAFLIGSAVGCVVFVALASYWMGV
jgi:hypothetical protein